MRLYLPVTLSILAAALRSGALDGANHAFGVDAALRDAYPERHTDELEYLALTEAATACLALLALDVEAPRRRAVLAAEVGDSDVRHDVDAGPGQYQLTAPIRLVDLASAHLDSSDAGDDVTAALAALAAGREHDSAVEALADRDLLWYGIQELPALLAEHAG